MNILEMAKKLDIKTTDVTEEVFYGVELSEDFDLEEVESIIDNCNDDGRVSEYADGATPIYYHDINEKYEKQTRYNEGTTIDDCIKEGMVEPMREEADISKAKQCALYMDLEREAFSEIEDFKKEVEEKFDAYFNDDDEEYQAV